MKNSYKVYASYGVTKTMSEYTIDLTKEQMQILIEALTMLESHSISTTRIAKCEEMREEFASALRD